MALLVWQDRLRDNRENLKYTQGFTLEGVSKTYDTRDSFSFQHTTDKLVEASFFPDRVNIKKGKKGDRLLFLHELSTNRDSLLPSRKSSLSPFFLLFFIGKKDAYKHVDLVQDLP